MEVGKTNGQTRTTAVWYEPLEAQADKALRADCNKATLLWQSTAMHLVSYVDLAPN